MSNIELDDATEVVRAGSASGVFVTAEHASERMPAPWAWPDEDLRLVGTHWAYDLGAAELARELADAAKAVAVLSRFSRLLCDPNRAEDDPSVLREHAERAPVVLNRAVTAADRTMRLTRMYRPFHETIDRELARQTAPHTLLSVHTFTPLYEGEPRHLEVGILFDKEDALGDRLVRAFAHAGVHVAPNEPYSGKAGLIYSAGRHADRHGLRAIELEVRHDLALDPSFRARVVPIVLSEIV